MLRNKTRLTWLALLVVFTLIMAACGDSTEDTTADTTGDTEPAVTETTDPPKDPISIAAINQEDGVVAWPEVSSASKAILAWYNAQGGLDGHPLELDLCTAGDDPESTQACALEFANDDTVEWVFPMSIPNSDAMFQVLGEAGKPMVGHLMWDIPDSIQPDVFSADPGVLPGATVVMEHLALDLGMTNIGLVTTDSPFGRDTADLLAFLLGEYGAATEAVFYDVGTADYLPSFAAFDSDAIDGIFFLPFTLAECVPGAEALATLGWDKPTISTDFCASEAFMEMDIFDGWIFMNPTTALLDGDADRDLLVNIFEHYGDGVRVDGFAVNGAMETFWVIEVLEDAYALAAGAEISADNIRQAATDWSGHLTIGPDTVDCPGPVPFTAVCNPNYLLMKLQGGTFTETVPYRVIDLSVYGPLLEG